MLKQWLKKDLIFLPTMLVLLLIVPCLFCWILGGLYVEDIPFGVVDLDNSALSRQIVKGLEDHPGLDVQFMEDQQTLEQAIDYKEIYGGIVIPQNFSRSLSNKTPKSLLTVLDGTNMLICNNMMAYVSAVTGTYNAGAMMKLLESSDMTADAAMRTYNTFQYVDRTLYDPYMSYMSYLLYLLAPYILQMIFVCLFAVPLFSELNQQIIHVGWRRTLKVRWLEVLVRCGYVYLLSASSSWIGYCLADYFFGLPLRGTTLLYFILIGAFELALLAISMMIGAIVRPQHCSYVFCTYIVLAMVLLMTNGAIWLSYLMSNGLFETIGCLWPFAHVAMPFKLLSLKGAGWSMLSPYVGRCLHYMIFWMVMAFAVTLCKREWYRWHDKKAIQQSTISEHSNTL